MVERKIVVDGLTLKYSGYFQVEELYKLVDQWFREKAYTKHEIEVEEQVFKDSKEIHLKKAPYKKINDYAKYIIQVVIDGSHIKNKIVDKGGRKIAMQEGDITVKMTGFLELDYEGRWQEKPMFYFLRAVIDQFIYRTNTERFEAGLAEETKLLYSLIKSFLNLHRY